MLSGVRDALIERHLELVPPIARRVQRRLPPSFELDDLVGEGNIGLMHAASRYRPRTHGGTPFSAFARPRIHGAIVDSVRRRCWIENTAFPLEDAPEPVHHRKMPFLIASRYAVKPPLTRAGRPCGAFPRAQIPRKLHLALRTLPEAQRWLLEAFYGDDLSFPEVAARMGITARAAEAWHRKALDRLRSILVENRVILPAPIFIFPAPVLERAA